MKWDEYKMINLYFQQSHIELYDQVSVTTRQIITAVKLYFLASKKQTKSNTSQPRWINQMLTSKTNWIYVVKSLSNKEIWWRGDQFDFHWAFGIPCSFSFSHGILYVKNTIKLETYYLNVCTNLQWLWSHSSPNVFLLRNLLRPPT